MKIAFDINEVSDAELKELTHRIYARLLRPEYTQRAGANANLETDLPDNMGLGSDARFSLDTGS